MNIQELEDKLFQQFQDNPDVDRYTIFDMAFTIGQDPICKQEILESSIFSISGKVKERLEATITMRGYHE